MNLANLLALVAALIVHPAWSAIVLVQKTQGNAANTSTVTAALSGVVAGDTLIAVLVGNSGATTPSSVTDSLGNSVATAVAYSTEVSHAGVAIFYVQNASAGAHTITATWSAANYGTLFVAEYSGLLTSGVFDVASPVAFASSTTISTASITPAQNGELLIMGSGQQSSGATYSSFTNGFSQQDSLNTSAPSGTWAALVQSTAASISAGATASTTSSSAAIAAFRPLGGPVGGAPQSLTLLGVGP